MHDDENVPIQRRNPRLVISDSEDSNTLDLSQTLDPIIGYAQEPLLPLDKACEPLIPVVYNILDYVKLALENTLENPADGLTRDESASIRLYTMEWIDGYSSLYSVFNKTLMAGNREDLKPWFKFLKLFLTALVKIPCAPRHTIWRGIGKNITDKYPPSSEVIWWNFSSCATSLSVLENNLHLGNKGERTLFSIEVFNGRNISAHSDFNTKDEILLLPGTCLKVQSKFYPAPNLHVIHLKQKIPKEILLESPFKDACLYPKNLTTTSRYNLFKKKRFIISISLVMALVALAAILGGVLGSRSMRNSSANTDDQCSTYRCDFSTTTKFGAIDYFQELLSFNCSQSLSNITIVIAVQVTVGTTFGWHQNTFSLGMVNETYQDTSSAILYEWHNIDGQIIPTADLPYTVEALFNFLDTTRTPNSDTYFFTGQFTGCDSKVITHCGHF